VSGPAPGSGSSSLCVRSSSRVNDTFEGQLDLEQHGGRTLGGVCARVAQRVLALTAATWHNDHLGAAIKRSLIAHDH
jgi:hypothetical protein